MGRGLGGTPPTLPAPPREGSERSLLGSVPQHLVSLSHVLIVFPPIVLCAAAETLAFIHI